MLLTSVYLPLSFSLCVGHTCTQMALFVYTTISERATIIVPIVDPSEYKIVYAL